MDNLSIKHNHDFIYVYLTGGEIKINIKQKEFSSSPMDLNSSIPANHPNFVRTVLIFDFQNLKKLGHLNFLEYQAVNIPVFKVISNT